MTNKVCIPYDIFRNSKLSLRAKFVWAELSLLPRAVNGEFVLKQKELSLQLGVCVSTLRRAIKSLEENQLIQFVGLFEKKYKKHIFKGVVDASFESLGCEPQEKEIWMATSPAVPRHDEPKAVEVAPKEAEQVLLRLKYKFPGGAPKPSDAENLAFTSAFYQIFHSRWLEEFPLLNGKDNRPLLDYDLIEMIVFS